MCIPTEFGGHGCTNVERLAVVEELLAAGAPVGAHWIADRQMAPAILRHGSASQRSQYLPAIAQGTAYMSIGMSEPESGSDLASVRTRAVRRADSWTLTGSKIWTTGAHVATAMVVLARTAEAGKDRHAGLTQFIVDLPHPRVRISPIVSIDGRHHFNEVFFDDAELPNGALLGEEGQGWAQVTSELSLERSGPERFMSTVPLVTVWSEVVARTTASSHLRDLGKVTSRLITLRAMSRHIAELIEQGEDPSIEAAVVKDLGTQFENDAVDIVRQSGITHGACQSLLKQATVTTPAAKLRGGTNEILRSLIARDLGVR